MSETIVTVDSSSVRAKLAKLSDALEHAAVIATRTAANAAAQKARASRLFVDRTGELRHSIQPHSGLVVRGGVGAMVLAASKHAVFVEKGTRAHFITPRPGGMLRFQVRGHWVFARVVRHPGTKPRPFMNYAAVHGRTVLTSSLQAEVRRALRGGGGFGGRVT